jgi:hypothetical protein
MLQNTGELIPLTSNKLIYHCIQQVRELDQNSKHFHKKLIPPYLNAQLYFLNNSFTNQILYVKNVNSLENFGGTLQSIFLPSILKTTLFSPSFPMVLIIPSLE